jgi:hypothetical protein
MDQETFTENFTITISKYTYHIGGWKDSSDVVLGDSIDFDFVVTHTSSENSRTFSTAYNVVDGTLTPSAHAVLAFAQVQTSAFAWADTIVTENPSSIIGEIINPFA